MKTFRRSFGRTLLRSSALGVSLAIVASAAPAFAQDAPQAEEAVDENEIIVTATRRSEALSDVPIAVSAVSGETLPNAVAAQGVERHWDVRGIALAFLDEFPVVAEAGDQADVVFHRAVGDVTGFDEVDDGEQHQRLVRCDAAGRGAGGLEGGEAGEPGGHGED